MLRVRPIERGEGEGAEEEEEEEEELVAAFSSSSVIVDEESSADVALAGRQPRLCALV